MNIESYKKWVVCLDLTKMDEAVVGYVNYLAGLLKPDKIEFMHVIVSTDFFQEIIEEYPEIKSEDDLNEFIREQVEEPVKNKFNHDDIETDVVIRKGPATSEIINYVEKNDPDLLVMGKKASYSGEGATGLHIAKYVPCSLLFIPETARYSMNNILVPVDFSEQAETSARFALQLAKKSSGSVTAQHLYRYPSQFFPYMPDAKTIKKQKEELEREKKTFVDKIKNENLDVELTLHTEGKYADDIYDLSIGLKTDMIIVFSKAKKSLRDLVKDSLADKMVNYQFGIPLFVMKNKDRYKGLLKAFLKG